MKLSDILKRGDRITMYTERGNNWRPRVLEVDDENQMALLDISEIRKNLGPSWYPIYISRNGKPYAKKN